jgi:hypothetical protein
MLASLFALGVVFSSLGIATAQQEPSDLQRQRVDLEIQKLQLEVDKLREDSRGLPNWLTALLGLLAGVAATATSVWVARRTRLGALDQSVHGKRLDSYPQLVKATEPLAISFPGGNPPAAKVGPKECGAMGQAMSQWYFGGGGLLLSVEARNAYFRLARALTRASLAQALRVPTFPDDAADISVENVEKYRKELAEGKHDLDAIDKWTFDGPGSATDPPFLRFKDYVFLQRLSSELRTKLSEDLRSRRRPA